jgi:hypothetical protein
MRHDEVAKKGLFIVWFALIIGTKFGHIFALRTDHIYTLFLLTFDYFWFEILVTFI